MHWVDDDAARRSLIRKHPQAALVSAEMPLRANLSVLENIAIVPQYRENMNYDRAAGLAWSLLERTHATDCALKRDPDLTTSERFVAKLLRALIISPPIILIERPALLLPDTPYPAFLARTLDALEADLNQCWIVDYRWNEPLYAPR